MTDMPTMQAAFRTTVSGGGKYEMVFRFPSMEAMHAADDEWRAALPIPEAPASVEPVAVRPIATAPIGEYVMFHFDGPFNDTECPGVSVGKKCADGRFWLTAIWASSTSHHDPVGWSPITRSALSHDQRGGSGE